VKDEQAHLEDRVIVRENTVLVDHPIRFEPTPRWVRGVFAGVTVASSKRAMLLIERHRMPIYYFPVADVRMDLLEPTGRNRQDEHKGERSLYTLRVGDRTAEAAAWMHERPGAGGADFRGYVAFYWAKLDTWYEEDDEVYVHPRDPYHRVDVLNSSRHVQITVLGELVADSRRPRVLVETGLPIRFYLPRQDVRMELLVPSATRTQCPYKGVASYWSVRIGDVVAKDMAWTYQFPVPECPRIENLVCFFNERVDAIDVDGERLPAPVTPWSGERKLISVR
jgi:uncharacterized protein (DUF427 family)